MNKKVGFLIALGAFTLGGVTCGSAGLYSGYSLAQPRIETFNYMEDGFEGMCVDYGLSQRQCAVDYDSNGSVDVMEIDTQKQEVTAATYGIDTCVMKEIKKELQELEEQKPPTP